MKKWIGLFAFFAVMIGVLYFLWIQPGIFFAISIAENTMFNLKIFAAIIVVIVVLFVGFLLLRKNRK